MTWLVTGGAGYVGASVVRAVSRSGRRAIVVDDLSTGDPAAVPPNVVLIRASVFDRALIRRVLTRYAVTGVIHLAGRKSVAESVADPEAYQRGNVGATAALLAAMTDVGLDRLVFSSSAAVYGSPEADLIDEDVALQPVNPYGATKVACERAIAQAGQRDGVRHVILRYFNVAGDGPTGRQPADRSLLGCALDAVERGARPEVFGRDYQTADGTCERDYVHVLDVADAHVLAVDALESASGSAVYNVGCGTGHSVLQVLDRIREVTGVDFAAQTLPRRPGDAPRVVASSERIRRELGWAPRHDLTDMIRSRLAARRAAVTLVGGPNGHRAPARRTGAVASALPAYAHDGPAEDQRPAEATNHAGRIQVISASIGGGHDGASRELFARLTQRGFQVDCLDLLAIFPGRSGQLLRRTYRAMLMRQPWTYDVLFRIACRLPTAAPATRLLVRPLRSRLLRRLPADVSAVVSTFPLAAQILGPMRRNGRLTVPAITYLTDFAVHPIWVADGMDMHCAAHEVSRCQADGLGASDIQVAGRLVSPSFRPLCPEARSEARRRLGLPTDKPLALLVAGSWGVGAIEATVAEVARTGGAVPVVVCGGNTRLYRRLRGSGTAHVFGWVDDMSALLPAVDILVENAGGLTAIEAMACGVPVVTYRPIAGHGTANAAAMAKAGVTRWVRRADDLGPALSELIGGDRRASQCAAALALFESDPATVIADLAKAGLQQQVGAVGCAQER